MKKLCSLLRGPVKLRPVEKCDLEFIKNLLNDPDISSSVVNFGFPISSAAQRYWYKNIYPKENVYRYVIEAQGRPVGTVMFCNIDGENATGELGYKVAREHQGNGYAYNAICALTCFLFEEKGIECIICYHLENNAGSKKLMEKAHFLFEGVQRSAVYKNGKRNSLAYWSCPRFQYEKIRKELAT